MGPIAMTRAEKRGGRPRKRPEPIPGDGSRVVTVPAKAGKGGRPRKRPEPEQGDRVPIGFRITLDLRKKLEKAAGNRSISAEAESRLERSFDRQEVFDQAFGGKELKHIAMAMYAAFSNTGSLRARNTPPAEWLRDASIYLA